MAARGGDKDEGQCGTCGGSGKKWVSWATEKGGTATARIDCTDCNGTGKK